MKLKKRSVALLCVLVALLFLMSTAVLTVGAEDEPMADSKTVILEYTGEPIDVSLLFDEQPAEAIYSVGSFEAGADEAYELNGSMLTVITPGSFRVTQTVDGAQVRIALGVFYTLTITVKDQSVAGVDALSSTLADVASVVGLREGDTLTAVTLAVATAADLRDHDGIAATAAVITDSEGNDVSGYYNVKSVNGVLHHFSAEWATEESKHFLPCSAFGCELRFHEGEHDFESACDKTCGVCSMKRDVPDHVWTADAIILREPTAEEAGLRVFICQTCGKERLELLPYAEKAPVVLIVCLIVACAIVGGSAAYFVVRNAKKKAKAAQNEQTEA